LNVSKINKEECGLARKGHGNAVFDGTFSVCSKMYQNPTSSMMLCVLGFPKIKLLVYLKFYAFGMLCQLVMAIWNCCV